MVQVRITGISGATYPVQMYISDKYGNNEYSLGSLSAGTQVPPTVYINSTIPAIFQTAPEIMFKMVDTNNCEVMKILDCTFGCAFAIIIE